MPEPLHDATLWGHVAAGVVALLAGAGAISTEKGGTWHVRAGRTYVLAMAVVVVTALPLSALQADYFLFAIAVFSGYLVFTGYRVLSRKRPTPGEAATVDWAAHVVMVAFGLTMLGLGARDILAGDGLGWALSSFGGIGLVLAVREIRTILAPGDDPRAWFFKHIVFMGAGYIATVTAAVTVNLSMVPPLARWLGPTVVGTPLILLTTARYRRRFASAAGQSSMDSE
jgi:uncharacterized membrane protein